MYNNIKDFLYPGSQKSKYYLHFKNENLWESLIRFEPPFMTISSFEQLGKMHQWLVCRLKVFLVMWEGERGVRVRGSKPLPICIKHG